MKNKNIYLILIIVIAAAILGGISVYAIRNKKEQKNEKQPDGNVSAETDQKEEQAVLEEPEPDDLPSEEFVTAAMYIPIKDEVHLFVGTDNGMVFTAAFPDEIYDLNGNKMTREELKRGNILELYGNGIMLESYPGQYPGINKMVVIEEGKPSDADEYQDIVDQFYQEPDPAQPPILNVEYSTELAVVTAMINRGGYEWTYIDEDGSSNAVVADSAHVLQWDGEGELNDLKLEAATDLQMIFSEEPKEVTVKRWSADLLGTDSIPEGEDIKISNTDETFMIPQAEGGYIYEVTGIWENGRVTYGFMTVS